MAKKIAINGYGRIGRCVHRILSARKNSDLEIAAINDITSPDMLAHLFKYDSVHRVYPGSVEAKENSIVVDGVEIPIYAKETRRNSHGETLEWNSSWNAPVCSAIATLPASISKA